MDLGFGRMASPPTFPSVDAKGANIWIAHFQRSFNDLSMVCGDEPSNFV